MTSHESPTTPVNTRHYVETVTRAQMMSYVNCVANRTASVFDFCGFVCCFAAFCISAGFFYQCGVTHGKARNVNAIIGTIAFLYGVWVCIYTRGWMYDIRVTQQEVLADLPSEVRVRVDVDRPAPVQEV